MVPAPPMVRVPVRLRRELAEALKLKSRTDPLLRVRFPKPKVPTEASPGATWDPVPTVVSPRIVPVPASVALVMETGPVPVPEMVVLEEELLTTSLPAVTVVPPV